MTVEFPCPTVFSSDYFTFQLTRVDLGLNRVVGQVRSPAPADDLSIVRIVRSETDIPAQPDAGVEYRAMDQVNIPGTCSFTLLNSYADWVDPDTAEVDESNRLGQFKVKLVRHQK